MCAVAVVVVGFGLVVYEIPEGHNPSFQALMAGVSSGIYEGYGHSLAGVASIAPGIIDICPAAGGFAG